MPKTDRKQLKRIAHHLDPVVIIGDKGITDGVHAEVERALNDHELIKVRLGGGDRDERGQMADVLCANSGAEVVQRIGKVVVLYKHNPEASTKLSNVTRYGS